MMQLDEVFTNSANGDNEQANLEVAAEIRKMQQIQMDQIFELQNEIGHMKALKDIPFELIKILRKQSSKARSSLADCEDDGRTLLQSNNTNSRKSVHRSKSRKPNRQASGNEKRDKASKHLGIEINSALDRMQELEAQNELLALEHQKHKDEMTNMTKTVKDLNKGMEDLEDQLKAAEKKQLESEKQLKRKNTDLEDKEIEVEKYSTKASKLAELNEELR